MLIKLVATTCCVAGVPYACECVCMCVIAVTWNQLRCNHIDTLSCPETHTYWQFVMQLNSSQLSNFFNPC